MRFDSYALLALTACIPGFFCLYLILRFRAGTAREFQAIRELLSSHREELAGSDAALGARQEALEVSFQSTRETLDPARLNRSSRAQALQLFRSGRSAESAAAQLGIARREARLLAKVADVLTTAG